MMTGSAISTIKVLIKPLFNPAHHVTSLSICLFIENPKVEASSALVSFPSILKRTLVRSEEGSVQAIDSAGPCPVVLEEDGLQWIAGAATSGDLKLSYGVTPLTANAMGSSLDLRCDHGGVLGSGLSFIPVPQTDQIYRNIVQWDLSQAPEGTRAVWTFGEGPAPVEKAGLASILSESVYMVGPIHSNPITSIPGTMSDYYGYYWFGDLPPNIAVIKDIHHDFLVKVSEFFQDPPSASNPYRTFVRNTAPTKSFGGTNYIRSQIFDYDDQIYVAHDYDLIRRMAYEIVHNFLGPSVTDERIDWLFEGIKNTLSIYLPFRTGFRTPDYFQHTMAMHCVKYYTNPLIHLTHDEAVKLAATNAYARELISSRA
jgi:hypothetical protein